jgi:Flp pilus assembly protein TadG
MRMNWLYRLWSSRDGVGAIEFGFIAPLLLVMLLGILDFGMGYWQKMQIANAANAGAQWAMANTYNTTSIKTVAQSATNLSGIAVAPSNPCGCATESGVVLSGEATTCSTCPDGSPGRKYIVVNTQICYATMFTWPGLSYGSIGNGDGNGCSTTQVSLTAQSVLLK